MPSRAETGRVRFGGDYNPEQWPEEVWAEDMALMREAGVDTATVGVFSWARIERRPGERDFAWLDKVLDLLHGNGIDAILATPTASPPPWLGHQYPETLPVTADGVRLLYGARNQFCPSSPVYRERADALVEDLAARYSQHPAVVMWHVNNELGPWCWCDRCADGFRSWLQETYGDGDKGLDSLNEAWGTAFWGQCYGEWDEIMPTRKTPYLVNPAQELDYRRYQSAALVACFDAEAAILRRHRPDIPVTTNLVPDYHAVDLWKLAGRQDVVSVDSYPDPALGVSAGAFHAYASDLARSLSGLSGGRPWLMMEQAPSEVNWRTINKHKKPGQMRLHSFQAIARGADASLFFQWRQAASGAERYHSGMLPNAGADTRGFREICAHGAELREFAGVTGTRTQVHAAVILDWPSRWALDWQGKISDRVDYQRIVQSWHAALWRSNITADFVPVGSDLAGYGFVLAPALHVVSAAAASWLDEYVSGGGHLLVGYLSGTVDETTRLHPGGYQHAVLAELLGVRIEELHPLAEGETVNCDSSAWGPFRAADWSERVHLDGAEAVAAITGGVLAGVSAATRHARGDGVAWYLAVQPEDRTFDLIVRTAAAQAGVAAEVPGLPSGVEAVRRGGMLFLLNHGAVDTEIAVGDARRVLTPFEVIMVKRFDDMDAEVAAG